MLNNPFDLTRSDDDEEEEEEGEEKKHAEEGEEASAAVQKDLYESRIILLFGEITQKVAQSTVGQLLALSSKGKKDIKLFINSQGGHVESGDSIHDTIKFIGPRVKVIGTGWVASAGVQIFLAARKEDRYCLPNTRFMIHQPLGGAGGPAADIAIEAKEIMRMRKRINEIIARETGQPLERVEKDTDRNFWMSADEARDYGLVSKIIGSVKELK